MDENMAILVTVNAFGAYKATAHKIVGYERCECGKDHTITLIGCKVQSVSGFAYAGMAAAEAELAAMR